MKHYHKARLKKLADHLLSGKLGHKKFSFNNWNVTANYHEGEDVKPYECGYAGCAIGECPIAFKKQWKFDEYAMPVLRKMQGTPDIESDDFLSSPEISGREFFGLDQDAFNHLFIPNVQDCKEYGGRELGSKAKASSVANNIFAFLAKQD